MKARAKDIVGRQHKGHFGRQRLDVLAKGICATRPAARYERAQVEIDFAHARRRVQVEDADEGKSSQFYIPSPTRIAPSTPRASAQKPARRKVEAHTSSSRASRSKVLDELDMSERRRFFRGRICGVQLMISLGSVVP